MLHREVLRAIALSAARRPADDHLRAREGDAARILGIPERRMDAIRWRRTPRSWVLSDAAAVEAAAASTTSPTYHPVRGAMSRKNLSGLVAAFRRMRAAPGTAAASRRSPQDVQLVVVCHIGSEEEERQVRSLVRAQGVEEATRFTNFVPHDVLVALYNGAAVFAFPSLYEGFGLPVLEAMQCGCPVVSSDASSLPEVVGKAGMLLPAQDVEAWAEGLVRVVSDEELRAVMAEKGRAQAARFSWERAGRQLLESHQRAFVPGYHVVGHGLSSRRLRVAYFSPLPPQKSGIADYSAHLVKHLYHYVDLDLYVEDGVVVEDAFLTGRLNCLPMSVFAGRADDYDVALYHVGNNSLNWPIYKTARRIPGVVVLHDYSLQGMIYHNTALAGDAAGFVEEMTFAYGERGRRAAERTLAGREVMDAGEWPASAQLVCWSRGAIVHSRWVRDQILSECPHADVAVIPLAVPMAYGTCVEPEFLAEMGVPPETFLVVSVGFQNKSKRIEPLVKGFLAFHTRCPYSRLVLVGEIQPDGHEVLDRLRATLELEGKVVVTGYVPEETMRKYVLAASVCSSLRYPTFGECSAGAAQYMAAGRAMLVTNVAQFQELPDDFAWKVDLGPREEALIAAYLERLYHDRELAAEMGRRARQYAWDRLSFSRVAEAYFQYLRQVAVSRTGPIGRMGPI
ncbi:glycosyltransferase [bacterium]|nr:glycosyltransferase [bacterium]